MLLEGPSRSGVYVTSETFVRVNNIVMALAPQDPFFLIDDKSEEKIRRLFQNSGHAPSSVPGMTISEVRAARRDTKVQWNHESPLSVMNFATPIPSSLGPRTALSFALSFLRGQMS